MAHELKANMWAGAEGVQNAKDVMNKIAWFGYANGLSLICLKDGDHAQQIKTIVETLDDGVKAEIQGMPKTAQKRDVKAVQLYILHELVTG